MSDRLVLEGDFEYGTYDWESPFEKVGDVNLLDAIIDFLGTPDEMIGGGGGVGYAKSIYKTKIRITIERIAESDSADET